MHAWECSINIVYFVCLQSSFVLTVIECLPLDPITNGFITYAPDTASNYNLSTVATYECDAGYFLDLSLGGSEMRTCVDDLDNDAEGVFSGQAPACIRKCFYCCLVAFADLLHFTCSVH